MYYLAVPLNKGLTQFNDYKKTLQVNEIVVSCYPVNQKVYFEDQLAKSEN